MTSALIPAMDWDGVETCNTCHSPLGLDAPLCEVCFEAVCESCREEIGGMTHCPECAQLAREFLNTGEVTTSAGESLYPAFAPSTLPSHGQAQFSGSE